MGLLAAKQSGARCAGLSRGLCARSGHQYEAALETAVKGQELLRRLRVPKRDEHWASFAELVDAIKEAAGSAAAAAGAAGIKGSGF